MDWTDMQQQDDEARQREILAALKSAAAVGLPPETIDLLAYECGVREVFNKEKA